MGSILQKDSNLLERKVLSMPFERNIYWESYSIFVIFIVDIPVVKIDLFNYFLLKKGFFFCAD